MQVPVTAGRAGELAARLGERRVEREVEHLSTLAAHVFPSILPLVLAGVRPGIDAEDVIRQKCAHIAVNTAHRIYLEAAALITGEPEHETTADA
jgi:hypothetical protein